MFVRFLMTLAILLLPAGFMLASGAQAVPKKVYLSLFSRVCPMKGVGTQETVYGVYGPGERGYSRPRWVRKPKAGEKAAHQMRVTRVNGRIRIARLQTQTPSGDWIQTVTYCFRGGGALAHTHMHLRTFQGNVIVDDRQGWKKSGQRDVRIRTIKDLKSGKILKDGARGFHEPKYPVFGTTQDVIFYAKPALR